MSSSRISGCRSCGSPGLRRILDLGNTPLANRLVDFGDNAGAEPVYPLELVFCPSCGLLQITETVQPDILFTNYVYFSSFSDTMVAHAAILAAQQIAHRNLGPRSLVVEAASNDGYLLQHYKAAGIPVLGIEPAANVAAEAVAKRGIPTDVAFFGVQTAERLVARGARADVFHAHNVLAHVPDLNGFVAGIKLLLAENGVAVIEVPYGRKMIDERQFDTIYHEHLCYFTLTALDNLLRRHGLEILEASVVPIHGGSLRVVAGHQGSVLRPADTVVEMLAAERTQGLDQLDYYARFATDVLHLRELLTALLADLKAAGKSIAAYGASAKGSTLLNYCGIGRDALEFVADRSTVKQGRLTPGTRLPIVPTSRLLDRRTDYCLLLTWNFADEILAQQAEYRMAGGKFIVPIPDIRVV